MIIVICGRPKSGKTFLTKELCKKGFFYVCDLNSHYTENNFKLIDWDTARLKIESETALNIIIEDATPFFGYHSDKEFQKTLVRHRHINKNILFNFHALGDVPLYLWRIANKLILFPTLDFPAYIQAKFKHTIIEQAYNKVNANKAAAESTPYLCREIVNFY
jgi:hypothetical protein